MLRSFVALAIILMMTLPAAAEKRVALVIGNDDYPALAADEQLKRAVNDANTIGDALQSIGFEVLRNENASRAEMLRALLATAERLESGDLGFFFYAGHGVSIDGSNYLLPTDIPSAEAGAEDLIKLSSVSEATVIETLKRRGVRVAIVVLDACRNNPFAEGGTRALGDAVRGLSRPPAVQPQGVFGLYSAGFGEKALDGLGDDDANPNSVFTRVLAPALKEPGQSLLDVAYQVNEEVARLANTVGHQQNPAYYDQARARDIFLTPRATGSEVAAPPAAPACTEAASHYHAATRLGTRAAFEDHLKRFGACAFAGLAAQQMAMLETEESAPPNAASEPSDVAPPEAPAKAEPAPILSPVPLEGPPQPEQKLAATSPESPAGGQLTLEEEADQASAECDRLSALGLSEKADLEAAKVVCEGASFKLMKVAADLGDAESQYVIGSRYQSGEGVARDEGEAVAWYRRAVEQDYGDGHWGLGLMYQDGLGGLSANTSLAVHHVMRALWRKSEQARKGLIEERGARLSSATIKEIVRALEGLGYATGPAGDTFDSDTLAGLEQFAASDPGDQP